MRTTPGEQLRELVEGDQILVAPGVYDALTALTAQRHGFDALYMTGGGTVNAQLGLPDIGLATMSEMVQNVARITSVVSVPVIADADDGYGNALAVMRTVRAYEQAGVAGIHLEDQAAPKRCGHLEGKRLVSISEMAGKIRAAAEARSDPSLVIIARTDAAGVEGLEGALTRASAYVEAGADMVFPEALTSESEYAVFRRELQETHLLANMTDFGKTPYFTADEFEGMGYSVVIFPMMALRLALRAVDEGYEWLRSHGTQKQLLDRMRSREELYGILKYGEYESQEERFG